MDLGTGIGGNTRHSFPDSAVEKSAGGFGKRNGVVALLILLIILGGAFLIGYWGHSRGMKDFFEYTGPDGEVYRVQKIYDESGTMYRFLLDYDGRVISYMMRNSPLDLGGVDFDKGIIDSINKPNGIKVLYVTRDYDLSADTDGKSVIAASEFIRMLGKAEYGLHKLNVLNVFTDYDYDGQSDTISCANVSSSNSVIYLRIGDRNRVYSEDGCVIVEGADGDGLIKSGDRLAYYLMGVM